MKKTVGCFTEEKLNELSAQPNTVVYKPTHDIVFTPWPASKVSVTVDDIIKVTKSLKNSSEIKRVCMENVQMKEFSVKYTKMFEKLCDIQFVNDPDNIEVLKRMILLRAAVDQNMTTEEAAQAQVSDISLKSLAARVKNAK